MDTFIRHPEGYPQLDQTPIDNAISNHIADGFEVEPKIIDWATYGRMKSILHRVLGKHVFDILLRDKNGRVNETEFRLASTIVLFYVQRPEPSFDLQSTLIANLVAANSNLSANHRAKSFSFCDKLIESCKFDRDYTKHIKSVLIDQGVLTTPWWTTVTQ